MRKVNIYTINEARVEQFRARWKEQNGEEIAFDRAVNIMIENIAEIKETRTLIVTLKEETAQQKPRKTIKRTSNWVTEY